MEKNLTKGQMNFKSIFFLIIVIICLLLFILPLLLMTNKDRNQLSIFKSLNVHDIDHIRVSKQYYSPKRKKFIIIKNEKKINNFCYSIGDIEYWSPNHPANRIEMKLILHNGYKYDLSVYFDLKDSTLNITSYLKWGQLGKDTFSVKSKKLYGWFKNNELFEKLKINPEDHPASTGRLPPVSPDG